MSGNVFRNNADAFLVEENKELRRENEMLRCKEAFLERQLDYWESWESSEKAAERRTRQKLLTTFLFVFCVIIGVLTLSGFCAWLLIQGGAM